MQTSLTHTERMQRFTDAGLYLVTSQTLSAGRSTLEIIRMVLDAGVKLIQLREKEMSIRELTQLAESARELTAEHAALLLINDRIDVALAVEADGVHLGQDDLPLARARRIAPELIIGASTHSIAEARRAQADGASYINIGPLFPTNTKEVATPPLGFEGLRSIAEVTQVPFTVMGGIKPEHIPELTANGARTIAVVTAVTAAPDPTAAAVDLLGIIRRQVILQ